MDDGNNAAADNEQARTGAALRGDGCWRGVWAGLLLVPLLLVPLPLSGCRTAGSLGLPLSSGSYSLLSHAARVRQATGHQPGISTELAKSALPPHRVEAGDVLVIEPNDFNSPVRLQSDHAVQQDGTIELGPYGRLPVAGKTVAEIQQHVQFLVVNQEQEKTQARYALATHRGETLPEEGQADYGITVRLVNKENGLFYVMGEVNAPGSYPLVGSETVLDAIIAAGGLSDRASDHQIILTRPRLGDSPRVVLPVCYQQILQLGDVSTNYQLQPGDRIYVPSLTLLEDVRQSLQWGNEKSCPQCREYEAEP